MVKNNRNNPTESPNPPGIQGWVVDDVVSSVKLQFLV